jgi:phosphatidylinositol phospholipase C delta
MATATATATPHSAPAGPIDQAGGGASEKIRSVGTVNEFVLAHLKRIFECHASKDQKWGPEQTKTFLSHVQHQRATSEVAESLVEKPELGFNDFLEYMTSSSSSMAEPPEKEDLSWPLASYFISSSHNTYLSGNQLSSASSTDTYTNVLRRGCRCVEIDVWDGDESDSERSSHGPKGNDGGRDSAGSSTVETDKKAKRRSTYGLLREKLPRRLSVRLDKTTLGKRLEERQANRVGAAAITGNKEGSSADAAAPKDAVVEPRVLHGHTLTKEISFRAVCVAIRDSAFVTSDLPVIISFEVHCNPQQQGIMVDIMRETWKEYLIPEPNIEATELPSPADLRRKILVKVKYVGPNAPPSREGSGEDDDASLPDNSTRKPKKPSKIIQELSRLGVYTKAVSFKAFTQPEASMATHVFSLSEKKFLDHHESYGAALIEHNRHFLMRAYPSGLRIRSSNLNPAVFWGAGTQMVALNWQQTDEGTMLNEGMFAGSEGYVLKPEGELRESST